MFAAVNARAPLRVVRLSSKRIRNVAIDWKGSAFEQVAERVATELRATFRAHERAKPARPGAAVSVTPPVPRAQPVERVSVRPTDNKATNIGVGLARSRLGNAVATGALAGAAIGGGLSVVSNGVALKKGEKAVGTATIDTLKDTASSSATGAVVGGLALATQSTLLRAGATGLASGAAPVAIALVTVDVGKGARRLLVGEIDGREFYAQLRFAVGQGWVHLGRHGRRSRARYGRDPRHRYRRWGFDWRYCRGIG